MTLLAKSGLNQKLTGPSFSLSLSLTILRIKRTESIHCFINRGVHHKYFHCRKYFLLSKYFLVSRSDCVSGTGPLQAGAGRASIHWTWGWFSALVEDERNDFIWLDLKVDISVASSLSQCGLSESLSQPQKSDLRPHFFTLSTVFLNFRPSAQTNLTALGLDLTAPQ